MNGLRDHILKTLKDMHECAAERQVEVHRDLARANEGACLITEPCNAIRRARSPVRVRNHDFLFTMDARNSPPYSLSVMTKSTSDDIGKIRRDV